MVKCKVDQAADWLRVCGVCYLIGAVLQSLHQVVPAQRQLLRVRLNALPRCGAFQQLCHILPCLGQSAQCPPLLRHVLLQALPEDVESFKLARLVTKILTFRPVSLLGTS